MLAAERVTIIQMIKYNKEVYLHFFFSLICFIFVGFKNLRPTILKIGQIVQRQYKRTEKLCFIFLLQELRKFENFVLISERFDEIIKFNQNIKPDLFLDMIIKLELLVSKYYLLSFLHFPSFTLNITFFYFNRTLDLLFLLH